jgi:hypothetical protein
MQARMKNPALVIPDVMTAIRALNEAVKQGGLPPRTLAVSQPPWWWLRIQIREMS